MTTSWIVVANASEAFIYQTPRARLLNGNASLELLNQYSHPESRKRDSDLTSDKPGSYKSGESARGRFVEPTDPKEHEAEQFAKTLAHQLDEARKADAYQDLIIVAPPHFHGLLNLNLNNKVRSLVTVNLEKDYTKQSASELQVLLNEHI